MILIEALNYLEEAMENMDCVCCDDDDECFVCEVIDWMEINDIRVKKTNEQP